MTNRTGYYNPNFDEVWERDFFGYLGEKPGANEHWTDLLFGGNPRVLTRMALLALDVHVDIELARENLRAFGAAIPRKLSKLNAAASVLDELNSALCQYRSYSGEALELSGELRKFSDFIAGFNKAVTKLSSQRLPATQDYLKFFLHAYIVKSTGKPQWRAMATLLEAAGWATYHSYLEFDDDCLRKKVTEMPARDPRLCSHLQQKAEQFVILGNDGWPSRDELHQVAIEVANRLTEERSAGTELSE